MDCLKWSLVFVCLCSRVTQPETSSWTVTLPSSVKGLQGSCVVIPCSFDYPAPKTTVTQFSGMWNTAENQHIYHSVETNIMQQYRNRTKLLGDIREKNCSLKIDPLQQRDQGPFYFRIEMAGYDKFSYKDKQVSITMISELSPISFSVKEDLVVGHTATASCSVSHSCSASPPVFNWSHTGVVHFQQKQLEDGQWNATSTLTFHLTSADHNKILQCTVNYRGGQSQKTSEVLKVNYAPVNVKVNYKSDIKEGADVQLQCSSDAQPTATSYEWYNESGAQLHQGNILSLPNVSRHPGAVYCTAINPVGQGKSSLVQLNVLYAPEVKTESYCSSEADMVKCVCIVESKPPSVVHFAISDRVLQSTKVEKHGSLTIGTLQAVHIESYEFIVCLANNTQGNANFTLFLPVNSKMQSLYIIIAIGSGMILLIILVAVGVVKKCRERPEDAPTVHIGNMKIDKEVELPQYTATKRKEKTYDDVHCPGIYANDAVYGNMEDYGVYANM